MKKTIIKLFGLTIFETTTYENEREMLITEKGGGEVIELSEAERKTLQE